MFFQMSYMISAWARICKIMGPRFAPYLPLVMGPIMKTASLKPEVALLDNEELGGVEHEGEDWQFVSLGDQQNFGIKTAGTDPTLFTVIGTTLRISFLNVANIGLCHGNIQLNGHEQ